MIRSLPIAVVALATSLAAQSTRVWPAGYQSQPGEGAMSAPFTISNGQVRNTCRSVTTIHASSLPFGPGSVIDEIAFRRDAQDGLSYGAASGTLELSIGIVDDAEHPVGSVSHIMAGSTRVFYGTINIPSASRPTGGPAPFSLVIPFSQPWTYPGGDLAFEMNWTDTPTTVWRRDAVDIEDGFDGRFETLGGHGVMGTHNYAPHQWTTPETAVPGGRLEFFLEGAPPERPYGTAIHYLGWPLPQPTPLNDSRFIGGELWVDPIASELRLTNDFSSEYARARISWSLGNGPNLIGVQFASQWIVLDRRLNTKIPVLASNALVVEIGGASSVANVHYGRTLWAYGKGTNRNHGMELGPRNYVPVTRFGGTFQ